MTSIITKECFPLEGNRLYFKREDLLPFSFGGNKARKAVLFFEEIDALGADTVVTYGSSSSNHCRVVANMAAARGLECHVISPAEQTEETVNTELIRRLGAQINVCPVAAVHDTIEQVLTALRQGGEKPYFIPGGGHGNIGTGAYVACYDEIAAYEKRNGVHFDYIFLASGTGTTQAGLICGQLLSGDDRVIAGISIARKNPRGRDVVLQSVREYLAANGRSIGEDRIQQATHFTDAYICDGYGSFTPAIAQTVHRVLRQYGVPLDMTYTGKAFWGMTQILREKGICNKDILFVHTGGTPLFFNDLKEQKA